MMFLIAALAVAGCVSAMGPAAGFGKHSADLRHGFVTVSDASLDFDTGGFSVEAWIRSDNPANGRYNSFVSHQLDGGLIEDQGNQHAQLNFQLQRNGELNAFVGCGGPAEQTRNLGFLLPLPQAEQSPLSANTGWTHVAVVIPDPLTEPNVPAKLYRNGAVVATTFWAEFSLRCVGLDMVRPKAAAAWNFGYYDNHDNGVQTWNGEIDEVRIWAGTRSDDEIRQNRYRSTLSTGEDGLRAWFRFNEMTGDQTPSHDGTKQATMVPNDESGEGLTVMWGYSTVGIWHPEEVIANGDGAFGSGVLPFTATDPATGEEWPPAGCPASVCQWVVLSLPLPGDQPADQPNWRVVVEFYGALDENDVADGGFATGASELLVFSNSAPTESNFIRYFARDERGNGLTRPSPGTSGGFSEPHTRLTFSTVGQETNGCTGEFDECGICTGEDQFIDDCGECFRNNADLDECGVCGGNGGDCSCPPPGYDGMWHADRMSYVLMKYAVGITLAKVDETMGVLEDIIDKFNEGYEAVDQRTFIDYVELSIAFCEQCLQGYLQELSEFEQQLMDYCAGADANCGGEGARSVIDDEVPLSATGDFVAEDLGMAGMAATAATMTR